MPAAPGAAPAVTGNPPAGSHLPLPFRDGNAGQGVPGLPGAAAASRASAQREEGGMVRPRGSPGTAPDCLEVAGAVGGHRFPLPAPGPCGAPEPLTPAGRYMGKNGGKAAAAAVGGESRVVPGNTR